VLEGQLRVHWGIRSPIYFRQKDESSPSLKLRHSWSVTPANDDSNVQIVSNDNDVDEEQGSCYNLNLFPILITFCDSLYENIYDIGPHLSSLF